MLPAVETYRWHGTGLQVGANPQSLFLRGELLFSERQNAILQVSAQSNTLVITTVMRC